MFEVQDSDRGLIRDCAGELLKVEAEHSVCVRVLLMGEGCAM